MRAFEVFLNGKRLCVAGAGKKGVLTTILSFVGRDGRRVNLRVGGLFIPEDQHVLWVERPLRIGDAVQVKIVESEVVSEPSKRLLRNPEKEIKSQKRYVRNMAKKFGWTILTHRKSK